MAHLKFRGIPDGQKDVKTRSDDKNSQCSKPEELLDTCMHIPAYTLLQVG